MKTSTKFKLPLSYRPPAKYFTVTRVVTIHTETNQLTFALKYKSNRIIENHLISDHLDEQIYFYAERPYCLVFVDFESIDDIINFNITKGIFTGESRHGVFETLYDEIITDGEKNYLLSDFATRIISEAFARPEGKIIVDDLYLGGKNLGKALVEYLISKSNSSLNIELQLIDVLQSEGISIEEATRIAFKFSETVRPEIDVLDAAQQLRNDFNRPGSKQIKQDKIPFPGRGKGIDPIEYLKTMYDFELKSKTFGPGQLQSVDQNLYTALREAIRSGEYIENHFGSDNHPASVKDLISLLTPGLAISGPDLRAQALGTILDASPQDAVKFFSRNRAARLKGNETGRDR